MLLLCGYFHEVLIYHMRRKDNIYTDFAENERIEIGCKNCLVENFTQGFVNLTMKKDVLSFRYESL